MSFDDKRNYLKRMKKQYDDVIDFSRRFNENNILKNARDELKQASDIYQSGGTKDAYKNELDFLNDVIKENAGKYSNPQRFNELLEKHGENRITDLFRPLDDKPKLKFDNKNQLYEEGSAGKYNFMDKIITIPTRDEYMPNILVKPHITKGTLAHEADHWVQTKYPKFVNTVGYNMRRGYFHINTSNNQLLKDFPVLKNIPFVRWQSSPHEWRSELSNFTYRNELPMDLTKWDSNQIKDFDKFMNKIFNKISAIKYPSENGSLKNINVGELVRNMFLKGYSTGGKLKK